MPITRSLLRDVEPGSAYYVFMHAAWRKKRGKKKPSMNYGGITNPEVALGVAANLFVKLVSIDHITDRGEDMLSGGMTYGDVQGKDLAAMVRYIVEESRDPKVVFASLTGMIDIPYAAIDEIAFTTGAEYLKEYMASLSAAPPEKGRYARKLLAAARKGTTEEMLLELYRARGGLVTQTNMIVNVIVRDRYDNVISL